MSISTYLTLPVRTKPRPPLATAKTSIAQTLIKTIKIANLTLPATILGIPTKSRAIVGAGITALILASITL